MILTIAQIVDLASNAGFSGPDLTTAVAVALAESNPPGNTESYNPETKAGAAPGQGSYGLWQIYLSQHPQFDPNQLLSDPTYNAAAAFAIYQAAGNSFHDWSTFKYGQYLNYVNQVNQVIAQSAAPAGTTGDGTTVSDGTANGSVTGAPADFTNYWPVLLIALELFIITRG